MSTEPGPKRFVLRVDEDAARSRVRLRFRPIDDPGRRSTTLELRRESGHTYAASGSNLEFDGRWLVDARLDRTTIPRELDAKGAKAAPLGPASTRPAGPVLHLIPRLGFVRVIPDRSARRVDIHAVDIFQSISADVRTLVLTDTRNGPTRTIPVRRVGRGHYAAALAVGDDDKLAVIAHLRSGERLRSVFDLSPAAQASSTPDAPRVKAARRAAKLGAPDEPRTNRAGASGSASAARRARTRYGKRGPVSRNQVPAYRPLQACHFEYRYARSRRDELVGTGSMPFQVANQTELYYEVRGDGPPLLLIMGASGCGGVFGRFAELLADEFTVVSYDRRGNARSPRPADWNATSPEEQADDAAELLAGLGLAPAAIFGTSSAGIFALAAVIRRPESVQGAVLHEPALFRLFDHPADVRETLTQLIKQAMEAGGPAMALERFIRFAAGDANWERLEPGIQQAMLASADTYFGAESGAFDSYLPNEGTLASITTPIKLLVSAQSHPFFAEAAGRLAELLGVEVTRTPGTHFPYLDHPQELVQTIKPFLRSVST